MAPHATCHCLEAMMAPSIDQLVALKVGNSVFNIIKLPIDGATTALKFDRWQFFHKLREEIN